MDLGSLESMWSFQRGLSQAQAMPVAGPLVISPIKAVVSLAQFISGFALSVILFSAGLLANNGWCFKNAAISIGHAGEGLLGLGYSLVNICTLGYAAYQLENVTIVEKRQAGDSLL